MEKCVTCGIEKGPEGFFSEDHIECRDCYNRKKREAYDPEKERLRYLDKKRRYGERIRENNKKAYRRYRKKNLEAIRARERKYYHDNKEKIRQKYDKEKRKQAVVRWTKRNKEKCRCAHLLRLEVKRGNIKKPKVCSVCGKEARIEGHHFDYNFPLKVIWCCRACHAHLDRIRKMQQESMKEVLSYGNKECETFFKQNC